MFLKATTGLLCLSLLFFLGMPSRVAMAEQQYSITGSELTRLVEISTRLEMLNAKLQNELTTSKKSLSQLMSGLDSYKIELMELETQLITLRAESETLKLQLQNAEILLEKAKESFVSYKTESEKKIKRLTIQRNVSVMIAVIAIIASL